MVDLRVPLLVKLSAALVVASFAGCLGAGSEGKSADTAAEFPPADEVLNPDLTPEELEKEMATTLDVTATSEVTSPQWTVGEFWSFHVMFGGEFGEGEFTFDAVVYEDTGSEYLLGTEAQGVARFEAMMDIPLLGAFSKENLDTTNGGDPIKLYDWPLTDDKSWQGQYDTNFDGTTEPYTFHAAFEPAVSTPVGELPGFTIHGIDENGDVLFSWDYVPALHFANHIFFYNPNNLEEFNLHLMVMDHGFNWAGTLFVYEATELLAHEALVGPPIIPGFDLTGAVPPVETFTVDQDYTIISGFLISFACPGVQETVVVSPSGKTYEARSMSQPKADQEMPCEGNQMFVFTDVNAETEQGTWAVAYGHAAVVSGVFAYLWGLVETTIDMGVMAEEAA